MFMIIKCIVLNVMVMIIVASYMVCILYRLIEAVVFDYIGVLCVV